MRRHRNPEVLKSPFRFPRLILASSLILDFSAPLFSGLVAKDRREPSLKLDMAGDRFSTRDIEAF